MKNFLSLAVLLATAFPAFANGGGYLKGIKSTGPFRPVNVDSVEMVSEKLDIELQHDSALISIVYQLHNPGAAVEVEMGFPCAAAVEMVHEGGESYSNGVLPKLEDFKLTADGKAVESKLVREHAVLPKGPMSDVQQGILSGWQVVKIPFAAGQTSTVAVAYRNPLFRDVSYMSREMYKSAPTMSYLFSAAGLWKGPIKSGEVTIRATGMDPDKVTLSHPKRFQRKERTWTWNFTDFDPTLQDDLVIVAGEREFRTFVRADENDWQGKYIGEYVTRGVGMSWDVNEMRKNGKWFFLSRHYTLEATSWSQKPASRKAGGPGNFPWVEDAKDDGLGESITLTMHKPVQASRLFIQNGYREKQEGADLGGMTTELFRKWPRVKKLGITINDQAPFTAELPDSYFTDGIVDLPAGTGEVKTVKLTIQEVYPGTEHHESCLWGAQVEVPLAKTPEFRGSR